MFSGKCRYKMHHVDPWQDQRQETATVQFGYLPSECPDFDPFLHLALRLRFTTRTGSSFTSTSRLGWRRSAAWSSISKPSHWRNYATPFTSMRPSSATSWEGRILRCSVHRRRDARTTSSSVWCTGTPKRASSCAAHSLASATPTTSAAIQSSGATSWPPSTSAPCNGSSSRT